MYGALSRLAISQTLPEDDVRFYTDIGSTISFRWTRHPVIVSIRDNRDYIRVLLYSHYTTFTGWGILLKYHTVP